MREDNKKWRCLRRNNNNNNNNKERKKFTEYISLETMESSMIGVE